jgi:hypothetical protein
MLTWSPFVSLKASCKSPVFEQYALHRVARSRVRSSVAKWEEWDMTGFARITRRRGLRRTGLLPVRLNDILRTDERFTRGVSGSDGF